MGSDFGSKRICFKRRGMKLQNTHMNAPKIALLPQVSESGPPGDIMLQKYVF